MRSFVASVKMKKLCNRGSTSIYSLYHMGLRSLCCIREGYVAY